MPKTMRAYDRPQHQIKTDSRIHVPTALPPTSAGQKGGFAPKASVDVAKTDCSRQSNPSRLAPGSLNATHACGTGDARMAQGNLEIQIGMETLSSVSLSNCVSHGQQQIYAKYGID